MAFPVLQLLYVGLLIASYYLREDPEGPKDANAARRGSSTVAEEGTAPALVLGKARVRKTNVLMYQGDGSFQDYMRESKFNDDFPFYRVNLQLGVCVRPLANTIVKFKRMWAGDTLITEGVNIGQIIKKPNIWGGFKNGGGVGVAPLELGAFKGGNLALGQGDANAVEISAGTDIVGGGPNINNDLVTDDHYGAAPGLCTIFLDDFQVGERPAMFGLSVEMVVWPDYTGTIESRVGDVSEVDANPAAALYQILTDDLIGVNLPTSLIDDTSFNTAAVTLNAEDHGFSIALDKTVSAKKLIEILIKQMDAVLYTDPETQLITLKLIREDYGAFPYAGLAVFDESNVLEVIQYKQTSWEDTFSQVRVVYEDRDVEYGERIAVAHDIASATSMGRLRSIDVDFPGVKTAALANKLASREMKFYSIPQTLVALKINREGNSLRPGDVIKWSNEEYGINNMILRIQEVDFATLEDGTIIINAARDNDSNVVAVFRDPDRHWTEDLGFTVPVPDCLVVAEVPGNPFFGDGGSNWKTPAIGVVATFMSPDSSIPNGPSAGSGGVFADLKANVSIQDASDTVFDVGNEQDATRCGDVGTAYSKTAGGSSYYDTGLGLVVGLGDSTVLRTSTAAEVRAGRAVILVNGTEYMSYESFTDLGGGSFRLNNVWRGLFDTIAEDHPLGASVFFIYDVNMGRATTQTRYLCGQTAQFRLRPTIAQGRQDGQADFLYSEVLITRRGEKASRATNFTLYEEGFDAVGAHRDVEYAFDEDDPTATRIVPFTGDDAVSSTLDMGQVFTNDLRSDWRRRPAPIDCDSVVVRGDDIDAPFPPGDNTRLLAEGKLDTDAEFFDLSDRSFNGDDDIKGNGDYFNMGRLLSGPGRVRLTSIKSIDSTGQELFSHKAEEILMDMIGVRQLLINRKFRPFWDIRVEGEGGYGAGKVIRGDGDHTARGWRSIGDIEPTFGVGEVPVAFGAGATLEQGDDTQGHSFYSEVNAVGEWVEVEQIMPVPYLDTEGSELWFSWYYYREADGGAIDKYRVTIETLDAAGVVLDTVSSGETAGAGARGWRRKEHTLLAMSAAVTAVRVTIGLSNNQVAEPNRAGNATMFMGRDISGQLLLDEAFDDVVTNWDDTAGNPWTSVGVVGSLQELDSARGTFLFAPLLGEPAEIFQVVSVPVEFNACDWVRLEFWTANTGSDDTISATVQARDAGAGVIAGAFSSEYDHAVDDQWFAHEVWLQIPPLTVDILVRFTAKDGGGGGQLEVAVAESNLRFLKADARITTLDYSTPVKHLAPVTPDAFESGTETPGVRPTHIFPMQDGTGIDPVDVLQGVVIDSTLGSVGADFDLGAEAIGLNNGTDDVSLLALELSKTGGGAKSTDLDFLNPNNLSFGIYMQFRITGVDHAGNATLIQKLNAAPTPTDGSGFFAYYDAATNRINFTVTTNHIGGNAVTATAYTDGLPADGAWHWIYLKYDVTAELLSAFSDYSAGVTAVLTTFIAEEMSNIVDEVHFGRNPTLGGVFDDGFDSPFQLAYLAIFRSESAEKFTRVAGQNLWKHATDPNIAQGNGLTYTRTGELLFLLSLTKVGTFGGTASGGLVQVPIVYNAKLNGAKKLLLAAVPAIKNWIPFAEDMSNAAWTKTNATISLKQEVSPRGVREAQVIVQSGVDGRAEITITGLTASTVYLFSSFVASVGATHDTQIDFTEDDLSTVLATLDMPTTHIPIRHTLQFTTDVGQTQTKMICYGHAGGGESTGTTAWFGIMLQEGIELSQVVLNYDAALNTSVKTQQSLVGLDANSIVNADEGAMETRFVINSVVSANTRRPWELHGTVADEDARIFRISTAAVADSLVHNGAGAEVIDGADHAAMAAAVHNFVHHWRAKANLPLGAFTYSDDNGAVVKTSATTWVPGDGITELYIGQDDDGNGQLSGGIQRIKLWKGTFREIIGDLYAEAESTTVAVGTLINPISLSETFPIPTADFSSALADDEWLFADTTGNMLPLKGTAEWTIENDGGASTTRRGVPAVGIPNGTDFTSVLCYERGFRASGTNDHLELDNTTVGGFGAGGIEDLCVRIVFRVGGNGEQGAAGAVASFYDGTRGWYVFQFGSGAYRIIIKDSNGDMITGPVLLNDVNRQGAWHYLTFFWDQSDNRLYTKSDQDADDSVQDAVTPPDADKNSTVGMRVGLVTLGNQDEAIIQVAYMGCTTGAGAQALYDEPVPSMWGLAAAPSGLMTTFTRPDALTVPIGDDFFATWGQNQLAWARNANFSGGSLFGIYLNKIRTNLVDNNFEIAHLTRVNCGWTRANAETVRGMVEADSYTATANNGYVERLADAVAIDTEYTASTFLGKEITAGATGRLIFYDKTNSAELAAVAWTMDGTHQRISVTATTTGTTVLASVRNEIDTNTHKFCVYGEQLELGPDMTDPIFTLDDIGGTQTLAHPVMEYAGSFIDNEKGEVRVVYIPILDEDHFVWWGRVAAETNNNSHNCLVSPDGSLSPRSFWFNNAAGTEESVVHPNNVVVGDENLIRSLWDVDGLDGASFETIQYLNGVRSNGTAHPLEGTIDAGFKGIVFGAQDSAFATDIIIQSIIVYNTPQAL